VTTKPAFVLRWQSPAMSGTAFWYYAREASARADQDRLQPGTKSSIAPVEVYTSVPLLDDPS
jgi:hypothetical protein